ncbi:fungal-specific transcription factor domain-containing protein [Exophiala viscosa]|uniref:fungal-specific transcription factor domain-containing protein n=1 Tax=Exophiala viscosa TaxID=2486360 RepID=UPI00219B427F|nr:fungal-specific transcription factor domain-containing protein [Exophiala viscosa]
MQDIKHQVKESYRRRRTRSSGTTRLHSSSSQRNRHECNASFFNQLPSNALATFASSVSPSSIWPQENPVASDGSSESSYSQHNRASENEDRLNAFDAYFVVDNARSGTQNAQAYAPGPECKGNNDPGTGEGEEEPNRDQASFDSDERGLDLIMYYLDFIYPRLVPYLELSAGGNGRGWLLNLFLRTKPLYTAAICLSACDKAQFVLGPLSDIPQPNHDLEMQHLQSVAGLRTHLYQLSKKAGASQLAAGVEALACIMHLILFELWIPRKGLMNDWVMHLDAASALLSSLDQAASLVSDGSPNSNGSDMIEPEVKCDIPIHLLSEGEKSAFEFFLGMYTYCFINATASLGFTPQSAQSIARLRALYHQWPNKLSTALGCEDWVMLTLLDIAVLKDWKQKESKAGTLSLRDLNHRANIIEGRLLDGLAKVEHPLPASASFIQEGTRMVTNTYINGALVYLHVVVSGFYPHIPEIRQSVLRTLQALEYMREHSRVNFPSWPYCAAGCLALESEYPRFRALVPPFEKGKHPLVLSRWTLEIIEECWNTRASQPPGKETCSWVTAMNHLGTRLLLL